MRTLMLFGFVVTALAVGAPPAGAAWPHLPNVNLQVESATGDQIQPFSVADGAGGFFLIWQDGRAGVMQTYAQHLNSAGLPQWAPNGVPVSPSPGDETYARVASDGNGGLIVAWADTRSGNTDVYAQRLNAAGTAQWTVTGVPLVVAAGIQFAPQLVSDGAGGAIVVWQDQRSGNYDVYAQHVNAAGTPQWAANGLAVSTGVGDQAAPQLASDGAGGAIITWHDARTGSFDIYAQRLNAAGQPNWSGTGYLICGAAGNQGNPVIVADGAGGAILAWWDQRAGVNATDIYGMRVNSSGIPIWSTSGIISGAPNSQTNPQMVSDGAGGAIVAWEDYRNTIYSEIYSQKLSPEGVAQWTPNGVELANLGNNDYRPVLTPDGTGGAIFAWWDQRDAGDVIAQRVSASGAIQWSPTGLPVCTALFEESYPSIVSDGAGGAILAWQDQRTGGGFDIYAQRVEHFGLLGNPEPAISGVRDVPNDQGGKVRVSWAASYLDAEPTYGIAEYRLWRATPVLAALVGAGSAARRSVTTDPDEAVATGALWAPDNAGGGYAWEYVASQPAAGFAQYSLVSPTTSDSVSQSNPRTAFLVEARAGTTLTSNHWLSAPDSGYSVDNLPPGTPSSLTGGYSEGTTTLHWLPNSDADLAGYRVYRGASANFMPDASSLVASPADTGWADPYGSPGYYKLSAVDVHGNESGFALFSPGTVDAPGGELPEGLALAPPRPNPAREDCAISGASPGSGDVALVVYDPAGRAVRELWRGVRAGPFRIKWDLKDDGGRHVPSGIYFVRLTAGSRSLTRRVVALK